MAAAKKLAIFGRNIEKLIHEFSHAIDTMENLEGEVNEKLINRYYKKYQLHPLFPFRSKQEYEKLAQGLAQGKKRILETLHNLLFGSNSLSLEEEISLFEFHESARIDYKPQLKQKFVPTDKAINYINDFKLGKNPFIVLGVKDNDVQYETRLYIKFFEESSKTALGQVERGHTFYGYTISDHRQSKESIVALYRDYIFELTMGGTYTLLYKVVINGSEELNYCLTMESYAILRRQHPAIIKKFYPEVVAFELEHGRKFLQPPEEEREFSSLRV